MNSLNFSLRTEVIPLSLTSAAGQVEEFELREMLADARDKYLDQLTARVNVTPEGKAIGIRKFEGLQSDLVCACLFRKEGDKRVEKAEVQKWPASVLTQVYKAAQTLNHLNEETKEAETKNDSPVKG